MATQSDSKSKSKETTTKQKPAKEKRSGGARFNPTMVRALGALMMFVGLMLCVLLNSMVGMFVTVAALAALVLGFYLFVSGIRVLVGKRNTSKTRKDGAVWIIMGVLLIAGGVLALLYRGQIANWVLILVGALIAACGLVMLIVLALAQRGERKVVLDVSLSVLTMVVGVLIALLVLPAVANPVNHLCFYLFGGLAIAVGGLELVLY